MRGVLMISDQYGWLIFNVLMALMWVVFYIMYPWCRNIMLKLGLLCCPYAFAEIVYIPKYWNPPSVFDITTLFFNKLVRIEVEAFICAFIVAGVGGVIYSVFTNQRVQPFKQRPQKFYEIFVHWLVVLSPYFLCPLLYFTVCNRNIAYAGCIALLLGALLRIIVRPDLKKQTLAGGIMFLCYYTVAFKCFDLLAPGYITRVWNLANLSGIMLIGLPIEEFYWGISFGCYASGLYEHLAWSHLKPLTIKLGEPSPL
jgi:hypothetical protein